MASTTAGCVGPVGSTSRQQPEPVERVEMDQAVLERRGIEGRDQHAASSHRQRPGPEQVAEERVLPGPGQLPVEQFGAEAAVVRLQVPLGHRAGVGVQGAFTTTGDGEVMEIASDNLGFLQQLGLVPAMTSASALESRHQVLMAVEPP
jgi:hypothetical protein